MSESGKVVIVGPPALLLALGFVIRLPCYVVLEVVFTAHGGLLLSLAMQTAALIGGTMNIINAASLAKERQDVLCLSISFIDEGGEREMAAGGSWKGGGEVGERCLYNVFSMYFAQYFVDVLYTCTYTCTYYIYMCTCTCVLAIPGIILHRIVVISLNMCL